MFDDVLTSSRGPGFIGMLLAILVLGGFGGMALIVLEQDSFSKTSPEQVLAERKDRLEDLEQSIESRQAELNMYRALREKAGELSRLQAASAQNEQVLVQIANDSAKLQDSIEAVYAEWQKYRSEYRLNERALWKGRTIDLSAVKGPRFKECKITSITPELLRVSTPEGVLRGINYKELPDDIQDQLQFADNEAEQYKLEVVKQKREDGAKREKFLIEQAAQQAANEKLRRLERIQRLIPQRERELADQKRAIIRWKNEAAKWRARYSGGAGKYTIRGLKDKEAEANARAAERAVQDIEDKLRLLNTELAKLTD